MTKRQRNIAIVGLGLLIAASVSINLMLRGPGRATVSDEAIKAAEQIVAEQGGGEQPRNDQGVHQDAVGMEPSDKPAGFAR